jgi:hypothetical protein
VRPGDKISLALIVASAVAFGVAGGVAWGVAAFVGLLTLDHFFALHWEPFE